MWHSLESLFAIHNVNDGVLVDLVPLLEHEVFDQGRWTSFVTLLPAIVANTWYGRLLRKFYPYFSKGIV